MTETLFYVHCNLKAASVVKVDFNGSTWWKATAIFKNNEYYISMHRTKIGALNFIKEIQNVRKDF